jgi:hypothetical protein
LYFWFFLVSCQQKKIDSQVRATETSKVSQVSTSKMPLRMQHSLANYKTYSDSTELESSAELIIIGRPQASLEDSRSTSIPETEKAKKNVVLGESVVVKDSQGSILDRYTITPVKVQKVIKGNWQDKEIKILQPAAVVQEPNQPAFISILEDYSPLQKNSKYLLYLKEVDTKTYPNLAGVYSVLSGSQGKFNFDKTDSGETEVESKNEQYRKLKENVRGKKEADFNAVP